ncbi:type II toxin-antitoxin system VapC family toxin [Salicibibacter cibarius]|uniref:Type II toxin-antitoxin system VapC family toxin n=1 Tax=Salicibibacter cibarius TaxID=2743000 RepID=A0A7T6Z6S8_9BACI|nr:type II toxin-antitoxin system VapC family toxin [Salicibibacter cibarius]QQK78043.1 type II toxin-antitoxin system VapC family toxin [Salicibibacter cibarius]
MLKTKIYLDTSVISALYDERSPERKQLTEQAWDQIVQEEVHISEIVLDELNAAPEPMKSTFLKTVEPFKILKFSDEAKYLSNIYVQEGIFPEKYSDDARHVAVATVNDSRYLLSWNFKHLVKVKTRKAVSLINSLNHYSTIEIIAPPEL